MYYTNYFSKTKVQSVKHLTPHNGFDNLFEIVQETKPFYEGRVVEKMEWMMMYQYPTCDVKDVLISEISFGILYIFRAELCIGSVLINKIWS